MSRLSFHSQWLCTALVVSLRGTCSRRLAGAVLTDRQGRVLSTGYNGPASGRPHCIDTPCAGAFEISKGPGRCEAVHAEQNALIRCAQADQIAHVYSTSRPCTVCTKMLLGTPASNIWFLEDCPADDESQRLWEAAGRVWAQLALPESLVTAIRGDLFSPI